jgi:hypothetical protein
MHSDAMAQTGTGLWTRGRLEENGHLETITCRKERGALLLYYDGQQQFKYMATQLCMSPFVVLVPVNANKEKKRK